LRQRLRRRAGRFGHCRDQRGRIVDILHNAMSSR
jgi:hypothetical protein